MPRLLNKSSSNNRTAIRGSIMKANARLMAALRDLQTFRKLSHLRLSQNAKSNIKNLNKQIRNAFRAKGHANVLPLTRNKMITKLANAVNAFEAAERNRVKENLRRKKAANNAKTANMFHNMWAVAKPNNPRMPSILVISPGKRSPQ